MIFVSSFRPFPKCTPEIAENQIRAFTSWLTVAERIIYVGNYCDELASALTEFVPFEGRPPIKMLAQIASSTGTWAALINSDIVVGERLREVEKQMNQSRIMCAISQRYDLETGFRIDNGLDAFFGVSEVWRQVALRIHIDFTIGRGLWDLWMLNFFVVNFGRKCADISRFKLIKHPNHGDRLDPNWESEAQNDKFCKEHHWPSTVLT